VLRRTQHRAGEPAAAACKRPSPAEQLSVPDLARRRLESITHEFFAATGQPACETQRPRSVSPIPPSNLTVCTRHVPQPAAARWSAPLRFARIVFWCVTGATGGIGPAMVAALCQSAHASAGGPFSQRHPIDPIYTKPLCSCPQVHQLSTAASLPAAEDRARCPSAVHVRSRAAFNSADQLRSASTHFGCF